MAIDIVVIRDSGDIEGEPIVDPLIGSIPCALQRGRNVLDGATRLVTVVDIEQIYDGSFRMGQIHQREDYTMSAIFPKSKITGITHTVSKNSEVDALSIDTTIRAR